MACVTPYERLQMSHRAADETLVFLSFNNISTKNTQKPNDIKCLVDENDNLDHSCGLVQNVGTSTYFEHRLLLGYGLTKNN